MKSVLISIQPKWCGLIARGIVKAENKAMQIKKRLVGSGYIKAMSKAECERWYNEVFGG